MEQEHPCAFGPFHLESPPGGLWQGAQAIALRPQSLALLRYLVAHPGRLVTTAELRQHVWAGTASGSCPRPPGPALLLSLVTRRHSNRVPLVVILTDRVG